MAALNNRFRPRFAVFRLRGLPVARVFVGVWDEPHVEDRFAVVPGIKSAIETEIRVIDFLINQSGDAFRAFNPSGSRTVPASSTGATGSGACT